MRFGWILLAVLVLSAAATYVVRFHLMSQTPKVPVAALLPTSELIGPDEGYERVAVTPLNLPRYGFTIVVPRGSRGTRYAPTPEDRVSDDSQAVALAEFLPPGRDDIRIEVRYVRPPSEVTLPRFVAVYARASGFSVVAAQPGVIGGVPVVDALLRKDTPGRGPFLTRLLVRRHGDMIFLVAGSCLEADYPTWKRTLGVAAVSLVPTGPAR